MESLLGRGHAASHHLKQRMDNLHLLIVVEASNPIPEVARAVPCHPALVDDGRFHRGRQISVQNNEVLLGKHLRAEPRQQNAQAHWHATGIDFVDVVDEVGGAGVPDGVVPFGGDRQLVGPSKVGLHHPAFVALDEDHGFEQPRHGTWSAARPDADEVGLGAPDVDQFEGSPEAGDRVEALPLLASNLNGAGKAAAVAEFEGKQRMGHLGMLWFERLQHEPNPLDVVEVERHVDPALVVLPRGPPMEITDVVQGHLIPIEGGPWRTGVVVDPIPLVGGLFQSEPTNAKKEPEQDRKEQTAEAATRPDQHGLHGP